MSYAPPTILAPRGEMSPALAATLGQTDEELGLWKQSGAARIAGPGDPMYDAWVARFGGSPGSFGWDTTAQEQARIDARVRRNWTMGGGTALAAIALWWFWSQRQ